MAAQSFNETFLGNADVPGGGAEQSTGPSVSASAVGMPAAVVRTDGTGNLRETATTLQAGSPSTPSGSRRQPGVQSFRDDL